MRSSSKANSKSGLDDAILDENYQTGGGGGVAIKMPWCTLCQKKLFRGDVYSGLESMLVSTSCLFLIIQISGLRYVIVCSPCHIYTFYVLCPPMH